MSQEFTVGCEPVPGTGYRLLEVLGRGGFGEVWKAASPGGAEVAIKVIRLGGREGRKEFKALQLVKKVRHPNLVPTIAFWLLDADGHVIDEDLLKQDDWLKGTESAASLHETMTAPAGYSPFHPKQLIVVMGLGDKSLNDRLEECQEQGLPGIPEDELVSYMEDAARAIDFLNSPIHRVTTGPAAIQHCDIKPHNIMIVGDSAQVCDFGLAQMLGADRTTTAAASLAYAAPECLRDGKPSNSTDQYSLAITYYELKTGLLPYREQTQMAVMNAKIKQELDLSEVPSRERAVLERATSANPEARFSSASEFVERLRAAVYGEDAVTGVRPRGGRGPLLVPITVTVGLGLLVLGGLWLLHRENQKLPVDRQGVAGKDTGQGGLSGQETEPPDPRQGSPAVDPVAEILATARRQQTAGEFREAADSYTRAIEIAREDAEAYFCRGQCYLALGEATSAIVDFERAAQLHEGRYGTHPEFADAYLARGTQALQNNEPHEGIRDLTDALRHRPRDDRAYSRRGVAHFMLKDLPEAASDLTASIEIHNDASDYVRRGQVFQAMGSPDEAIADFTKAAQIEPQNVAAYYYLGDCWLQRDERELAIGAFSDAIRAGESLAEPPEELSSAYALRAACRMQSEQFADAVADLTEAIRIGSQDLRSLYESRASCFEKLARMGPARYDRWILDCLDRLDANADDPKAHNELAYYLAASPEAEIRDGKKALEHARRACELTSWKEAEYLDTLAACYAESGDFAEAIRWSEKAIELAADAEAAEYYQNALKLYLENKPYRDRLEADPGT
jgi:serine/threonine protein kinase/tetratricopeptide (TPR) repeat protein